MHIAVQKGAEAGDTFQHYVDYLVNNGFMPLDARDWIDKIRTKGNDATHQIVLMSRLDAEDLLTFIEMLLRVLYEFPGRARKSVQPPPAERPRERRI